MPNVNSVLGQEIIRLAKKVAKTSSTVTRKLVTQHRRDIAAIKRQFVSITKRLAVLEKRQPKELVASPEVLEKGRFRAIGVKSHRAKLGLSALEYGKLVGVSALTIYGWESGKSLPRKAQKAKWLAIRSLGKREAVERIGGSEASKSKEIRKRGRFNQTAEDLILSLLKGRKVRTTRELAAAWKKEARGGTVDNALSRMVKAGNLKRKPLGGKLGSQYSLSQ